MVVDLSKRRLSEVEKELTEKGIVRLKIEVDEMTDELNYNMSLKAKESYLRKFDDKWREFLRDRKDSADKQLLEQVEETINEKNNTIKQMEDHLENGVEAK